MRRKKQRLRRVYIDDDDEDFIHDSAEEKPNHAVAPLKPTGWLTCENVSSSPSISPVKEHLRRRKPDIRDLDKKKKKKKKEKKHGRKKKRKKKAVIVSLYTSPSDEGADGTQEKASDDARDNSPIDLTGLFSDDEDDDDILTFRGLYTPGKLKQVPRKKQAKTERKEILTIVIDDDDDDDDDEDEGKARTPPMSPVMISQSSSSQPPTSRYQIPSSRVGDSNSSGRYSAVRASLESQEDEAEVVESVPWTTKHAPTSTSELGMHSRKIKDIREWLSSCRDMSSIATTVRETMCKALILCGPPGSCKSSVIHCLAGDLGLEVVEWVNPASCLWKTDQGKLATRYESQLEQFASFLRQCGRYNSLFGDRKSKGKLILIDDPPFLLRKEQLQKFRTIFSEYLSSGRFPLVFSLTDTAEGTSDMNRILGQLQYSPLIKMIKTRPVADTIMRKVLTSVLKKERQQVDAKVVGKVMDESRGDVRAALNNLQMLCVGVRPQDAKKHSTKRRKTARKTKQGSKHNDKSATKSIPVLSSMKDPSFSLFHGLGKVFHPKRDSAGRLITDPEDVHQRTPISTSQLTMFLHENLVSRFTDIDDVHEAMDVLSVCDLILSGDLEPEKQSFMKYAGSLAVRGVLNANKHPKEKRGFDAFYRPHIREFGQDSDYRVEMAHSLFPADSGEGLYALPARVLMTEGVPFIGKMVLNPVQAQNMPTLMSSEFTRPQQTFLYHVCSYGTISSVRRTKEARVAQGSAPESILAPKKFQQWGFGDTGVLSDDDIEED